MREFSELSAPPASRRGVVSTSFDLQTASSEPSSDTQFLKWPRFTGHISFSPLYSRVSEFIILLNFFFFFHRSLYHLFDAMPLVSALLFRILKSNATIS